MVQGHGEIISTSGNLYLIARKKYLGVLQASRMYLISVTNIIIGLWTLERFHASHPIPDERARPRPERGRGAWACAE